MKSGLAAFVICTSTLAQGVNFPIKYLLVTATQQGKERILVRDFHNLIGRAGRAGMHTEGSVIFTTPAVYDERAASTGNYRWAQVKRLLDARNAEPCGSGILALLDDYQQRQPAIVMEMRAHWYDLTFATAETIDAIVAEAVAIERNIDIRDFTDFINDRARAVQSIAAYLASHMNFAAEDAIAQVEVLAENTLAYSLATEPYKPVLVEIFRTIAVALRDRADEDLRGLIRVSPMSPSAISSLSIWLEQNAEALEIAAIGGRMLEVIAPRVLEAVSSKSLTSMSDRGAAVEALHSWCGGAAFSEIHGQLVRAGVRFSTRHPTAEHAVALCENGFGYDAAMVVASMADLTEGTEGLRHDALVALQKVVKYGLSSDAAIAFQEVGFADRIVATELAENFSGVTSRTEAKAAVRRNADLARTILENYPSYFTTVLVELAY